jgi:hypothetical protein
MQERPMRPEQHDPCETGPEAHTLVAVAAGIASGVVRLLPTSSAGVIIGIRSEWQLVAQRGPDDIRNGWCAETAGDVHYSRLPRRDGALLIAPFSSFDARALLVVAARPGDVLDPSAFALLRPLLDTGGALLDRALAAQERDRAVRRVILHCRQRQDRATRTVGDLERALAALWPNGAAHFYERIHLDEAPWSARHLVRTACERGEPAVGRSSASKGLLPPDLAYQVAIPTPQRAGAIVVESFAAGEEPDAESVAAAIALTRTLGRPEVHVRAG